MIAISQRDMSILSNIIETHDGIMIISKSCNIDKYPVQDNITRMEIYLAGFYFQSIDHEMYKTKVFSLTKANFGGSMPQKFIKKTTAMVLPKLYKDMENCMDKYYKLSLT